MLRLFIYACCYINYVTKCTRNLAIDVDVGDGCCWWRWWNSCQWSTWVSTVKSDVFCWRWRCPCCLQSTTAQLLNRCIPRLTAWLLRRLTAVLSAVPVTWDMYWSELCDWWGWVWLTAELFTSSCQQCIPPASSTASQHFNSDLPPRLFFCCHLGWCCVNWLNPIFVLF